MGDGSSDRPIAAGTSGIEDLTRVISTGWTDEKHSHYLNSIEASFVNQLYKSEYCSENMINWLSRTQKHTNSSAPKSKVLKSAQFKVLRRSCWQNLKFEKSNNQVDTENESHSQSMNRWIQHFRSSSSGKVLSSSNCGKDNQLASRAIQTANQMHRNRAKETTSSKQLLTCAPVFHQDSIGSGTEVSDQNFVDNEYEGTEPVITCRQKRMRNMVSSMPINDQVVPSGRPLVPQSSGEHDACLQEGMQHVAAKHHQ